MPFLTLANNCLYRLKILEYEQSLDFSRDKEHIDAQYLQIGVSMT